MSPKTRFPNGSDDANRLDVDVYDDDDDLMNDPNRLNDPAKLMRLEFGEEFLQEVSRAELSQGLILQDELFFVNSQIPNTIIEEYRKLKSTDTIQNETIVLGLTEKIEEEQVRGMKCYTECKSKPFWNPKEVEDMLTPQLYEKLDKWVKEVSSFSDIFEKASQYRMSRKSIVNVNPTTSDKEDNTGQELLNGLGQFCQMIQQGVKEFEAVLPRSSKKCIRVLS